VPSGKVMRTVSVIQTHDGQTNKQANKKLNDFGHYGGGLTNLAW